MLAARRYGYTSSAKSCGEGCTSCEPPKAEKNKRSWKDTFSSTLVPSKSTSSACCSTGACEKKRRLPSALELTADLAAECCRMCWEGEVCCGKECCEVACCVLAIIKSKLDSPTGPSSSSACARDFESQAPLNADDDEKEEEEDAEKAEDEPALMAEDVAKVVFAVTGITCADCSLRLEKRLCKKKGILKVQVSAITSKAEILYNTHRLDEEEIADTIKGAGFGAEKVAESSASSSRFTLELQYNGDDLQDHDVDVLVEQLQSDTGVMSVLPQRTRGSKWLARLGGKKDKSADRLLLIIEHNPDEVGARQLIQTIEELNYTTTLLAGGGGKSSLTTKKSMREADKWQMYLAVSALFGLPMLLTAFIFPQFTVTDDFLEQDILTGLTVRVFIEWILSTPIQFGVGYPLYLSAFKALWYGRTLNMDTLVMLSTTTAYVYSVISTILAMSINYSGDTFFETSAILLMLIMLGRYLEVLAKSKTSDVLTKLLELQADSATLLTKRTEESDDDDAKKEEEEDGYIEEEIPIELVQRGDILKIVPGAKVPIDGIVIYGSSVIDESMVTGESMPVAKEIDSLVYGGTINHNGMLHIRAIATASNSMLASIGRLVEQAQASKPAIQRTADKVAMVFIPMVVIVTLVVLVVWLALAYSGAVDTQGMEGFPFALQFTLAVLVVSCPCAIGLAAPTAIMVATGVAARKGILFKGGPTLEAAHSVNTVVFDKTGTLSHGKPQVVDYEFSEIAEEDGGPSSQLWHLIGAAESGSEHPLAQAMVRYAESEFSHSEFPTPEQFESVPGKGISCVVEGQALLLGNRTFITEDHGITIPQEINKRAKALEKTGQTLIWVAVDEELIGWVALADTLKPEAAAVVARLHATGIEVWMISGDNSRTAKAVAAQLGIENYLGGVLPADKAEKVKELQQQQSRRRRWLSWLPGRKTQKTVAMVGDGVNDSPALAQADVGIAVKAGTDIALEAADMVLMKDDLKDLLIGFHISKTTYRLILFNFLWAFLYNATAIPLAAGVLYPADNYAIPPAVAGLSEILSSLPVVLFSLLLRFYRVPSAIRQL